MTSGLSSQPSGQSGGLVVKAALVGTATVLAVALVALGFRLPPFGRSESPNGPQAGGTSSTVPPADPGLSLTTPPPAPLVLPATTGSPALSVPRLRRHLAGALTAPGLGGRLAFSVSQLGNPDAHWAYGARTATPASTLKLLTCTAALSVLGPSHRFTTTVVAGVSPGSLVLVGGGDPLLAATAPPRSAAAATYPAGATLYRLAQRTAAYLARTGVRRVRLGYDASLFTGPAVNPHWPSTYQPDNVVSPISALWVNEGRVTPGLAQRSRNPALAAAETFRGELSKAGVAVTGPVAAQRAPRGAAQPLAEVQSAPLQEIVQHILEQSDNEGAEVLMRQVALEVGRPGSSIAGVAAVRSALGRLGLDLHGAVFYDGSGLSRDDELPTAVLTDVLETDASQSHPQLRGVVTSLPVAGFSGSLGDRFDDGATEGRGYVRAKTGTLTGVHALAGLVTTRSGEVLIFVVDADRVAVPKTLDAVADLDRIAADLSTCGC